MFCYGSESRECWKIGPVGESLAGEATTLPDSDWQLDQATAIGRRVDGHGGVRRECDQHNTYESMLRMPSLRKF